MGFGLLPEGSAYGCANSESGVKVGKGPHSRNAVFREKTAFACTASCRVMAFAGVSLTCSSNRKKAMVMFHLVQKKALHRLLWGALLLLPGCRRPLQLMPLVETTTELRRSLSDGFMALNRSLTEAPPDEFTAEARQIQAITAATDSALLGLGAYASALNQLAAAGTTGRTNAEQAAASLQGIVSVFASPALGAVLGLSTAALSKLYGQIAQVKTARSLQGIMAAADPAVQTSCQQIAGILQEITLYSRAFYRSRSEAVTAPGTLARQLLDYEFFLKKEQQLLIEKLALLAELNTSARPAEALARLQRLDSTARLRTAAEVELRLQQLLKRSKQLDEELARISPAGAEARRQQADFIRKETELAALLARSQQTLAALQKAHQALQQQLGERIPPNFGVLAELTHDLNALRSQLRQQTPVP